MRLTVFLCLVCSGTVSCSSALADVNITATDGVSSKSASGANLAEAAGKIYAGMDKITTVAISGDTPLSAEDIDYIKFRIPVNVAKLVSLDLSGISFVDDKFPDNALDNDVTGAAGKFDDLSKVILPETLKIIGEGAFYSCGSLRSIAIPESVTVIGEWAFAYSGLESVKLPGSIEIIKSWTFGFCNSLRSVVLPCRLKSIEKTAFAFSDLRTVAIPESVETVGHWAFRNCSKLEAVLISDIGKITNLEKSPLHDIANVKIFHTTPAPSEFWPQELPEDTHSSSVKVGSMPRLALSSSEIVLKQGKTVSIRTNVASGSSNIFSRDEKISWGSTSQDIATVTPSGDITALSVGTATIWCSTHITAEISGSDEAGDSISHTFKDIPLIAYCEVTVD